MQVSPTNSSSDPTLSKLLEIDADLASQEAQLLAQIEGIGEKRKSLQSVVSMFSSNNHSVAAELSAAIDASASTGKAASPVNATANHASAAETTKGDRKSSSTSQQSKKATNTSKGKRREQGLQDYMRPEFEKNSLPQAVSTVLQQQPDKVMGIPEMIDSIYVDETPKAMRSKASTRIANALSAGLKENKWYRGKTGRYSLSQAAARADLSS
ncbi:hypothetical protein IQ268_10365 [Oculatella sp. LEGE 06141]|uniref:hypothetical protein n=1 Tax=Oculatella sp. LEGE 06141 TaxID=1828648 RepID=UPI00187F89AD|nr:hypothetical protein [Oculatella sp. LEGE 06141]MBE9178965.1 hypothetical protein [Oculatella sp. LEGE 06141]